MYFDKIFSEHFRDVAVVTGMAAWLDNGNPLNIDNHKGVGESLKKDHGKQNLKRASFMLHYSANNAYKSLFSKSLSRYHADKFMKLMNVEYIALSDGKKGRQDIGCVEHLAVRMFHQEKYMIIQMLGKVHVNITTRVPKGVHQVIPASTIRHKRGLNFVYYHQVGEGNVPQLVSLMLL